MEQNEEELHRRADCVCFASARDGDDRLGDRPEAGNFRADVSIAGRMKYAGLGVAELRRLKQLEEERAPT